MNDKTGTSQIHGYNELTQKLFTRAEYCDSKDYFEGELIELRMGDIGLGHKYNKISSFWLSTFHGISRVFL